MITYNPSPTRSLDGSGGSVELLLQVVDGSEGRLNSSLEGTITEDTAIALALGVGGCQVGPEERVVNMTCTPGIISTQHKGNVAGNERRQRNGRMGDYSFRHCAGARALSIEREDPDPWAIDAGRVRSLKRKGRLRRSLVDCLR